MSKFEIKSRWDSDRVIFTADLDASLDSANYEVRLGAAVKLAVKQGASLVGARLVGASLDGASLDGASLDDGSKITKGRAILMLGPIGSANRYFVAYATAQGLRLRTGCFFGTVEAFEVRLGETHGANEHAVHYRAALDLIRVVLGPLVPAERKPIRKPATKKAAPKRKAAARRRAA